MYMRLQFHSKAVRLSPEITRTFDDIIRKLLHLPDELELSPRRLSPLDSELGTAVLEIMRQLKKNSASSSSSSRLTDQDEDQLRWVSALRILRGNINVALEHDRYIRSGGGCEALYGRVGLLWALFNLRRLCHDSQSVSSRKVKGGRKGGRRSEMVRGLADHVRDEVLQKLVDMVVEAGKTGAEMYKAQYGEKPAGMRLIWNWHDSWYLGA